MSAKENELQPNLGAGIFVGKIGVDVYDPTVLGAPEWILDRTVANGIDVQIEMKGLSAGSYWNGDTFSLTAYLEHADLAGADQTVGPLNFTGGQGDWDGTHKTLTFPPVGNPTLTRILIPANTIPDGIYRMTVVMTHTPVGANQKLLGFVEYGMVEFFTP